MDWSIRKATITDLDAITELRIELLTMVGDVCDGNRLQVFRANQNYFEEKLSKTKMTLTKIKTANYSSNWQSACGERYYLFFHKLFLFGLISLFSPLPSFLFKKTQVATIIPAWLGVWRSFSYSDTLR